MMKNKFVFLLLSASLLLTACGSSTKTGDKTRKDASSKVEQSQSSSKDDSKKAIKDGKMVPYDHVNKFKNTKSSKGVLDKKDIYRYDFLKKDDTVYDEMFYQDVKNILPVHEQKKVDVTLATNFTIDGKNFNFKDLTVNKLSNILTGKDIEEVASPGNWDTISGLKTQSVYLKLPNSKFPIKLSAVNPNRRQIATRDALVYGMTLGTGNGSFPDETVDYGERISYEGINFNITRMQFLDKVKIKNPVLSNDGIYKYEHNRYSFISYMIQPKNPKIKGSKDSYVNFTFTREILTEIRIFIDLNQLGIEESMYVQFY